MNQRFLFLGVLAAALAIFAAGSWYASRSDVTAISAAMTTPQIAAADSLVRDYSPVLGEADAPVTVVEFFDPACEACRAFHPVVKGLLDAHAGDLRMVLRYTPFHGEASETAVRVLEAARMQGVFEPVLEALLAEQPRWAAHGAPRTDLILEIAATAGLDAEAAKNQMRAPDVTGVLNQDRADVETVGVRGTPTFFVNGRPLPEFGAEALTTMVEAEVAALGGGG